MVLNQSSYVMIRYFHVCEPSWGGASKTGLSVLYFAQIDLWETFYSSMFKIVYRDLWANL